MILTHRVLGRALHLLACRTVVVLTLVGVALQVSTPPAYPPALLAGAGVALFGTLGWALADLRHETPRRSGMQALVVVATGLFALTWSATARPAIPR
jgi:hypothetical protein